MYQLIIHHDVGVVNKEGHLEIDKDSPGHVYLELKGDDDSVVCGVLSGVDSDLSDLKKAYNSYQKYIIHGQERLKLAREYEAEHPEDKILHSKAINIKEIQYLEAMVLLDGYEQYIGKKMPSEIYGLLDNNCAHFVNHIYKSMGLEGDYTRSYRAYELNEINTKLTNAYKAVLGFYPGDKSLTVFGSSIEEVAKKYNVDVSKVTKKEPTKGIPDMEVAMMQEACDQISFEIAPNLELLDHSNSDYKKEKTNIQEDTKKVIINNPNKVINDKLEQLLSNPDQLKQYQQQSINDAFEGLKIGEKMIPGMTEYSVKSANEHYEFLQGLVGIKDPDIELEKIKQYKQKSTTTKSNMQSFMGGQNNTSQKQDPSQEDNQDWLNNLVSHTQTAMNEAYNDPDMQQFLQSLGNNSEFKFEDDV
jgi:hypothetical protein